MSHPLRVLFSPFGSEGDVNPLVLFAAAMQARGHHVKVLLNPFYAERAEAVGVPWHPVGTVEQYTALLRNAELWNALTGSRYVSRAMLASLPAYADAACEAGDGFDLVVHSTFGLGAATLAEARHVPRMAVHYQPMCFWSVHDPPLFFEGWDLLRRAPKPLLRLLFAAADAAFRPVVLPELNRFRRSFGLGKLSQFYRDVILRADGVAALFPDWFAAPQSDWPANVRTLDFPLAPVTTSLRPGALSALPTDDRPLVVWTHGSANFDVRAFHHLAIATTRRAGLRALLVSLEPPDTTLPPDILHVPHIDFAELFPAVDLVVHHGGIGTTAEAVRAAVPQIIIPRAHDQPDNARRVEALGVGRRMSYARPDPARTARLILEILSDPSVRARAAACARQLSDPFPALTSWAEELALTQCPTRSPRPPAVREPLKATP